MLLVLLAACRCGGQDPQPPVDTRPAALRVAHDPAALVPYPRCVAYRDTVCDVCGDASEACVTIRTVTDLCAQRATCDEAQCDAGAERLRTDPAGAKSEMCTQ